MLCYVTNGIAKIIMAFMCMFAMLCVFFFIIMLGNNREIWSICYAMLFFFMLEFFMFFMLMMLMLSRDMNKKTPLLPLLSSPLATQIQTTSNKSLCCVCVCEGKWRDWIFRGSFVLMLGTKQRISQNFWWLTLCCLFYALCNVEGKMVENATKTYWIE